MENSEENQYTYFLEVGNDTVNSMVTSLLGEKIEESMMEVNIDGRPVYLYRLPSYSLITKLKNNSTKPKFKVYRQKGSGEIKEFSFSSLAKKAK